jgi:DNA-binding CsgD family transcriptional regulator
VPIGRASSLNQNREQALRLVSRLSRLENEMLARLVNGHSVNSIATMLALSPHQVEQVKESMMRSLSATGTADAVRIGLYAGVH